MYETLAKLNLLFKKYFSFDILENPNSSFMDYNLLLLKDFYARDLLYLLYKIEDEFKIEIPEIEIDEGNFITFNKIASIIQKQCELKELAS